MNKTAIQAALMQLDEIDPCNSDDLAIIKNCVAVIRCELGTVAITESEIQSAAAKQVLLEAADKRILAVMEIKDSWVEKAQQAAATERAACASTATRTVDAFDAALERIQEVDATWKWAMDEMSQEVNEGFVEALAIARSIPDKIRLRG